MSCCDDLFLALVAEAPSARHISGQANAARGTPIRTWQCTNCGTLHTEKYVLEGIVGRAIEWLLRVRIEHAAALRAAHLT